MIFSIIKRPRLEIIYQSESQECGAACLCMIANWFGTKINLRQLRHIVGSASRGLTLKNLVANADLIGLRAIPLKGEPEVLISRVKPCILHWNFNHFVVFHRFRNGRFEIYDPAVGVRRVKKEEFSKSFTGVFVEIEKTASFEPVSEKKIPRLISYLRQTDGIFRSLSTIITVALVLEIFSLLGPLYLQFVIDNISSKENLGLLETVAIGFFLLLCAQSILGFLRSILVVLLTQHLALQWPVNIFAHMVRLPMEFFYRHALGDITSRFNSLGAIQQKLTVGATEAFLDGIMAVASLCIMLIYAPVLTAISLVAICLQSLIRSLSYHALEVMSRDRLVASAKENTYFLETVRAMLPLKLFSRELERRVGWQSLLTNVQQLDILKGRLDTIINSLITFISAAENIVVIFLGIRLVYETNTNNVFTLGMLIVFLTYKSQFLLRVNGILKFAVEFRMIRIHTERLGDIILTEREETAPEQDLSHLPAVIELRNVSFRYDDHGPWILRNISCIFFPGERVAVIGQSGEGKTTILKIILGLLTPTEGQICYGGTPVTELGINNVRPLIGAVMQEDVLLFGSIRQNISFFDQNAKDQDIAKCAVLASIDADIQRMPMGYQTLVGDLGDGLSGGQKQRILLARAIFKNPKIIVLDEATSHLDTENESSVNHAISELQITRIVVAHRHSTIAGADRVLRLAAGTLTAVDNVKDQSHISDTKLDQSG